MATGKFFWRSPILSALRTGLACLLATILLQYAQGYVKWTSFSVFSFILALVIVGETSTLGNALLTSFSIFVGGVQGLLLGMLVLNALGAYIPMWTSVASVFCCSMVIAYTPFTSLLAKRIALTVASHLFAVAFYRQEHMDRIFYPLRLGCTMLLGIGCGLVALTLPPRTASRKVQEHIFDSTQVISQAFGTSLDAFCCHDKKKAMLLWHQAKQAANEGSRIISDIHSLYMVGSRVELQCTPLNIAQAFQSFGKRLEKFMLHLKAMERGSKLFLPHALANNDEILKDLSQVREWSALAFKFVGARKHLQDVNLVLQEGAAILKKLEETSNAVISNTLSTAASESEKIKIFSSMSFLYNTKLFVMEVQSMLNDLYCTPISFLNFKQQCPKVVAVLQQNGAPHENPNPNPTRSQDSNLKCPTCSKGGNGEPQATHLTRFRNAFKLDVVRFILAFKISLAISLSAFLGFMYDKKHAFWATLVVGMGFRTFQMASIHGVVLGTIYGYLLSFWTRQHPYASVGALVPLIVFVNFIRRSKRQYSYMGNTAVTIGAIFLIGHRHKVQLNDFAMERITLAFLGLVSYILVENLIFRRHPSVLAKEKLVWSLDKLHKCFKLCVQHGIVCQKCFVDEIRHLKMTVVEVESLVQEATMDPCQVKLFTKISKSVSQMVEILCFMSLWQTHFTVENDLSKSRLAKDLGEMVGFTPFGDSPSSTVSDMESQVVTSNNESIKADYIWVEKFDEVRQSLKDEEQVLESFGALIFDLRILAAKAAKLETYIIRLSS